MSFAVAPAAVAGALLGATLALTLVREHHLFRYFKERRCRSAQVAVRGPPGNLPERPYPISQQLDAGIRRLFRMKLRCRQRPVLHRGEESATVICPCQRRGGEGRLHLKCPLPRCERVHEIKSLTGKTVKEHRPRIGFNSVPSHMRQHRCIQPCDRAGPLAQSLRPHTALHTPLKHHLHAHADAQHLPSASSPPVDNPITAHGTPLCHDRVKRTDPGHNKPRSLQCRAPITRHLNGCARALQRLRRRVNVARPVVEHNDPSGYGHSAPLVEGMPRTAASLDAACRKARANALNSASAMWCGSRPPSSVMCTVIAA